MVLLAVLVVVLLVGGVATLFIVGKDDAANTPAAVAAASAELPNRGDPTPVLAALSSDAPAPTPDALRAELTPLLAFPALGTGLSAELFAARPGSSLCD